MKKRPGLAHFFKKRNDCGKCLCSNHDSAIFSSFSGYFFYYCFSQTFFNQIRPARRSSPLGKKNNYFLLTVNFDISFGREH